VREIFITNYLNLTGTIALFYFGSEAVIRVATQLAAGRVGAETAKSQTPATTSSNPVPEQPSALGGRRDLLLRKEPVEAADEVH
jgi:hypothetical protein